MKKRIWFLIFLAYCSFLIWLTIISRQPRTGDRIFKWQLLWSYRAWIAGENYGKSESIQNIQNILVFVPFGLLFPVKRWKPMLTTVLVFSAAIEFIQYVLNLGWCEIDDVICNVLGAALGMWIWLGIRRVKGKNDEAST